MALALLHVVSEKMTYTPKCLRRPSTTTTTPEKQYICVASASQGGGGVAARIRGNFL